MCQSYFAVWLILRVISRLTAVDKSQVLHCYAALNNKGKVRIPDSANQKAPAQQLERGRLLHLS